jgi:hypothetical protein
VSDVCSPARLTSATLRGPWAAACWLAYVFMLLWPALLHGQPAYFYDSVAYLNTGISAFQVLVDRLADLLADPASSQGGRAPTPEGVVTIRAISYSLFVAVTSAPRDTLFGTIVFHAAIMAWLALVTVRAITPGATIRDALLIGGVLAVVTSLPWFTVYAMPDVFAGALILVIALLASGLPLSRRDQLSLVLLGSFAVSVHASHVLLGIATLAAAIGLRRLRRNPILSATTAWASAPVALGVVATLALSVIGFGEVTVAPKRLPFTLARSIEDGPARWHLEKHCATERYTVCQFFETFPSSHLDFLFGPKGINSRATPEQMEAMRREELVIVGRASREYPLAQAAAAARNFGVQLVRVGLKEMTFDHKVAPANDGDYDLVASSQPLRIKPWFEPLIVLSSILAVAYLILVQRGSLIVHIALFGLLANAAITSILSAVADRYQTRVIWVLPVLALCMWLRRYDLRADPKLDQHERGGGVEMIGSMQEAAANRQP